MTATAVADRLPWERIQQRIHELEVREQVLMDIHVALGVQWGEDPYAKIEQLLRTDVVIRAAFAIAAALDAAIDEPIIEAATRLRRERDEAQTNYDGACRTIAEMHAAAVVVEDVAAVRNKLLMTQLALEKARDDSRPLTVRDFLTVCRVLERSPEGSTDREIAIELERMLTNAAGSGEASPREPTLMVALATMQRAFERSEDYRHTFVANVAVLLQDRFGVEHAQSNAMADAIVGLVFEGKR